MAKSQLILRAVEPEDIDLLYKWENDRSVWRVSNTLAPFSRYLLERYIESDPGDVHSHKQLRMMIDILDFGRQVRTVGAVDLFDYDAVHQRAGIGIFVASDDRRKGHAHGAIAQMMNYSRNVLYLHQLFCNIPANNTASIRLFKKVGFKVIGTKKDWLRTDNIHWEDELMLQYIF